MKVGVPKEIKRHEYRVGLTPACVREYVKAGHEVVIETGAGLGSGFSDTDYQNAGAFIDPVKKHLFDWAEMIVKVKEPIAEEYDLLHEGQTLYTFLHLAADELQTRALLDKKVKAVAYETITEDGFLPCLNPMSEIAGRLAIQEGAKFLEKPFGGSGVLLGGVPGVERGKVAIIGGGVVGLNAAKIAVAMGAEVAILDISAKRMAYLDDIFGGRITTLYSSRHNIEKILRESDLVVGAILIPGAATPKLVSEQDLALMKPGSVVVDVAVDQGGCFATTRATTHDEPTFDVNGIVHYCVANMPGAVPRTSTVALTAATLKYGLELATKGVELAVKDNLAIKAGLNVYLGECTCKKVAQEFSLNYTEASALV